MSREAVVKVERLSKKFTMRGMEQELTALNEVSFSVSKGQSLGIFGLNGSGKSTLLKILSGITKPTSGSVEIHGRVASILDIGAGFHPELSGHENVFLNGQLLGFSRKEIAARYDEIIAFSGVERFMQEPVKNFSNGMYLRLAFSIMAHLDFDIYLFDEVMHVGDAAFMLKTQQKIMQLSEAGKTIIIVSHNLNDLAHCDLLMELNAGSVKHISTQKDILAKYITEAVTDNAIEVITASGILENFQINKPSSKVSLERIRIRQQAHEEGPLRSSLPLIFEITYKKLTDTDTLDVVLVIGDSAGSIVLVSAPFISGVMNEATDKGEYTAACEIPANFFSTNVYTLGITFVKNAASLKNVDLKTMNEDQLEKAFDQYGAVASYSNALYFSVEVSITGFTDLGKLKLPVGYLLPVFNWSYTDDRRQNKSGL